MEYLKVLPINREVFTSFQKCFLPLSHLESNNLKTGQLVFLRTSSGQEIIVKVYTIPDNVNQVKYCEIDDCVRHYGKSPTFDSVMEVDSCEIILKSCEPITFDPRQAFSEVVVDVIVDEFVPFIMNNSTEFQDLLRDLLKCYIFGVNSVITVHQIHRFSFGVKRIHIVSCNEKQFATVSRRTVIKIRQTLFRPKYIQYTELGGCDDIFNQLSDIIENSITDNSSGRSFNQILIAGPSGVGKTSIVNNLSLKRSCNLFEIRLSDIMRSYPGETEMQLRSIFNNAFEFSKMQNAVPSIILIEDIDQFCPKEIKNSDASQAVRISTQLLSLLDKVNTAKGVLVFATTSNIDNLDLKIRRPGRLEVEIFMSLPSATQRKAILDVLLGQIIQNSQVVATIAQEFSFKTQGYVGADLSLISQNIAREIMAANMHSDIIDTPKLKEFFTNALKIIRPSCLRENIEISSFDESSFSHIGGVDDLKKTLEIAVLAPLQHPEAFARFNLQPPKGILLYGPPGCAKTTMAKYLASKSNMTFLAVSSAEIYSPYVGDAEKFIEKIFNKARMSAPAIIFFDEIDSLVGTRSKVGKSNDVQSRVLSTLLTEMDGIGLKVESQSQINTADNTILVIAATNRPDMIDDALMRPGRFDKLIYVAAPNETSRQEIFRSVTQKMPLDDQIDFGVYAAQAVNYSGADLFNLCNEAALHALTSDLNAVTISKDDFDAAFAASKPSLTKSQIEFYTRFAEKSKI